MQVSRTRLSEIVHRATVGEAWYRDPAGPATDTPGEVPASLQRFARDVVREVLGDQEALDRCEDTLVRRFFAAEPEDDDAA